MNGDFIFEFTEPQYFGRGIWVSFFILLFLVAAVLYLGIRSYQSRKNYRKILFRRTRYLNGMNGGHSVNH